jgi:hypothetical protein
MEYLCYVNDYLSADKELYHKMNAHPTYFETCNEQPCTLQSNALQNVVLAGNTKVSDWTYIITSEPKLFNLFPFLCFRSHFLHDHTLSNTADFLQLLNFWTLSISLFFI